jgi:hypothetical protein
MTVNLTERDLAGFRPGAPSWLTYELDSEVCHRSTCSRCGHTGLSYQPYVKPSRCFCCPPRYRAFTVCPGCNRVEEF